MGRGGGVSVDPRVGERCLCRPWAREGASMYTHGSGRGCVCRPTGRGGVSVRYHGPGRGVSEVCL